MAELTTTGLSTRTQAEILTEIEADQRAEISESLDQSTAAPLGQINRLIARGERILEEALAALYNAIDPDSAFGAALFALGALTGTIREPATASRCLVDIDVDSGTYAIGTLVIAPDGRPEDRFANVAEVTVAGEYVFEALETGPIVVNADTFVIADPLAGFNAVVSHPDATPGKDIETEAAFRIRREQEIQAQGSSSVNGIVADLTQDIPDIVSAFVTENDTDSTIDSVPPHSIEAVVYGPDPATDADNDLVAGVIFAGKAAGIGTYGTIERDVVDSEGFTHIVRFTRPTVVELTLSIDIAVNLQTYAGDAAVTSKIIERAAETFVPGLDASWSQVLAWVHEVPGVLRASNISINSFAFQDFAIHTRQIARFLTELITINSTGATP